MEVSEENYLGFYIGALKEILIFLEEVDYHNRVCGYLNDNNISLNYI